MSDKNKFDIEKFIKEAQKYIKSPTSWICVNEVKKWDINPRTITQEGIDRLKNKIMKYPSFFLARPIMANYTKDSEPMVVFAGNQRLEASLQLGMEKVPVVIFNNLPEKMQKDFAIIDNHNDGEYDMAGLKLNFKEVDFLNLTGIDFHFNPPKIDTPTYSVIPTIQGKTEEIPADITTKQEQQGYPVSNSMPENNVENLPEPSNEIRNEKRVVKCPHCGKEFEI